MKLFFIAPKELDAKAVEKFLKKNDGIAALKAARDLLAALPEWSVWDVTHRPDCRFVAEDEGLVCGWAALTPVSGRCVYAGVAEVSAWNQPGTPLIDPREYPARSVATTGTHDIEPLAATPDSMAARARPWGGV